MEYPNEWMEKSKHYKNLQVLSLYRLQMCKLKDKPAFFIPMETFYFSACSY